MQTQDQGLVKIIINSDELSQSLDVYEKVSYIIKRYFHSFEHRTYVIHVIKRNKISYENTLDNSVTDNKNNKNVGNKIGRISAIQN